jgi:hypothetical protein
MRFTPQRESSTGSSTMKPISLICPSVILLAARATPDSLRKRLVKA